MHRKNTKMIMNTNGPEEEIQMVVRKNEINIQYVTKNMEEAGNTSVGMNVK